MKVMKNLEGRQVIYKKKLTRCDGGFFYIFYRLLNTLLLSTIFLIISLFFLFEMIGEIVTVIQLISLKKTKSYSKFLIMYKSHFK